MPAYTVCFCGTACSRDEGEKDRIWGHLFKDEPVSFAKIYDARTGYIPVRIHLDISAGLRDSLPSVTVRGVGENDWAEQAKASEMLIISSGNLTVPGALSSYVSGSANGANQRAKLEQIAGHSAVALALHGANLAARSDATVFNFLGHSRGAVETIMAAWFIYAYGGDELKKIPINIFAIDPVPGPGEWYGIFTQLPPNVRNYVGVYAWDHLDTGFSALIPRPNARMLKRNDPLDDDKPTVALGGSWDTLAKNYTMPDPLAPSDDEQPVRYLLYACRGRHGTVAGNTTSDGLYATTKDRKFDPSKISAEVSAVPKLVYKMARGYLTEWGTTFHSMSRVTDDVRTLRRKIHSAHGDFDAMAGGEARTARFDTTRPLVRRVSSIAGSLAWDKYYLEDVVGDPPFKLFYPCTIERKGGGWVRWRFL